VMTAGVVVIGVFKTLGDVLGGVAAAVMSIATGEFSAAYDIIKNTAMDAGANITSTMGEVGKIWDETTQKADSAAARQMTALKNLNKETEEQKKAKERATAADKAWQESMKEAAALIEAQQTPLEAHRAKLAEIEKHRESLVANGADVEEMIYQENVAWELAAIKMGEYQETSEATFATLNAMITAHLEQMGSFAYQQAELILNAFLMVKKGIGDSIAAAIVDGASLSKSLEALLKNVAKSIISTYVQIGIERLVLSKTIKTAELSEGMMGIMKGAAVAFSNVFSSIAAIPIVGPFLAPVAAVAAGAAVIAGGKALMGSAHGGLDYVPDEQTYLLQRGERVLSPRQNTDLTEFLNDGGAGGGPVIQNLTIHVLENATNVDAFARMDKIQLRQTLGYPIIDALNEMSNIGVRPDFATGVK